MEQAGLIPTLQADALAREVAQQLKAEATAVTTRARDEAQALVAQAHVHARARMHAAIVELRREGARRRALAQAQRDAQERARAQAQAQRVVGSALPLLLQVLEERWRDAPSRERWIAGALAVAADRLRSAQWVVEHAADWTPAQRCALAEAAGARRKVDIAFEPQAAIAAGLRIRADGAVLDATPAGLLADQRIVAALLFDEIARDGA